MVELGQRYQRRRRTVDSIFPARTGIYPAGNLKPTVEQIYIWWFPKRVNQVAVTGALGHILATVRRNKPGGTLETNL